MVENGRCFLQEGVQKGRRISLFEFREAIRLCQIAVEGGRKSPRKWSGDEEDLILSPGVLARRAHGSSGGLS